MLDKWYSKFKVGRIIKGINNLCVWFTVIWNDRDYDDAYIYKIMHKKLERMESFYRSEDAYTLEALKTADEIKEVKDLLNNYINHIHIEKTLTDDWNYDEYEKAEQQEESDLKKAFELIANKSRGWWD